MKKFLLVFALCTFTLLTFAQKSPVSFTASAIKKAADTYEVTIGAKIAKPWHIYSQFTPNGGPEPTLITFSKNPLVRIEGKTREIGKLKTVYDNNFKTNVKYFDGDVKFVQTVKVKPNIKTSLNVKIEYMVCDEHQCLPPTSKTLSVKLQ